MNISNQIWRGVLSLYTIDKLTVSEYLEKLASPSFPGPAGGSAAATVAAMAAALLEMSCKVTMNKDAQNTNLTKSLLSNIEAIRNDCLLLATEDMRTYAEVVRSTRSKKEFPDEYEAALKKATDTLAAIIKHCNSILTLIEQVIKTSYFKVLGDLGGSAYMAEAAAAAAKQGVEINLKLIHDQSYTKQVQNLAHESHNSCSETKDRIVASLIIPSNV